jgi:hypothetical protein
VHRQVGDLRQESYEFNRKREAEEKALKIEHERKEEEQ